VIEDDVALVPAREEVRPLHVLDPLLVKQSPAVDGDVEARFGNI